MSENTPSLEDTAARAADGAVSAIEAVSKALTQAVDQYGETAYEAALWVVRIDGLSYLARSAAAMLVAVVLIYTLLRLTGGFLPRFKWAQSLIDDNCEEPVVVLGAVVTISGAVASFFSLAGLFNIWAYTRVFAPELWLAKMALEKVM